MKNTRPFTLWVPHTLVTPSQLRDEDEFSIHRMHPYVSLDSPRWYSRIRNFNEVEVWDECFSDKLWVARNSIAMDGVIRAESWNTAWECYVDELMADGDEDPPWPTDSDEFKKELAGIAESEREKFTKKREHECDCWDEAYSWRGSGVPSNERLKSHIAAHDLSGESLDRLTDQLADELCLTVRVTNVYHADHQAKLTKWESDLVETWNPETAKCWGLQSNTPGRHD